MPYSYLVESKYREGLGVSLENTIIIIDEAHNIAQSCEEAASIDFTEQKLIKMNIELKGLKKEVNRKYNESKEVKKKFSK